MNTKKSSTLKNEAEFEAEIHRVIGKVCPWIPASSIRHQTQFSFRYGRKEFEIDGASVSRAEARSDILIFEKDRPLAVLELKRPGVALSSIDVDQGLSYARMLHPSPPLVIVTNGDELRIIEAFTGEPWRPQERTESSFQNLLQSSAQVAKSDVKWAIETLMGTNADVWMQAVRQITVDTISELTAWDNPMLPFAENFLIPRTVTESILNHVLDDKRLVLLEGPPLSGKSNVLRDLSIRTKDHPTVGTLFTESGGGGIFRAVSDALSRSLNWDISTEDARNWLRRIAEGEKHKLLLMLDNFDPNDGVALRELEDLSSLMSGPGLSVVVALDDVSANELVLSRNRSFSRIGRKASRVAVDALSDHEFESAQQVLGKLRIKFMDGAKFTSEYRQPWILRAVCAPMIEELAHDQTNRFAAIPPLLSLDLILHTRERFTDDELRRLFRALAEAVVAEKKSGELEDALQLESAYINIVRRETLIRYVTENELTALIDGGYVKPYIHALDIPVVCIRLPELLASELASVLAKELISLFDEDGEHAAKNLAAAASNLPLGDVIAAFVLFDLICRRELIPSTFLAALWETPPKSTGHEAGSTLATYVPEVGFAEIEMLDDGTALAEVNGYQYLLHKEVAASLESIENYYQWLILSHLAGLPLVIDTSEDIAEPVLMAPHLLLRVGTTNLVLRRPNNGEVCVCDVTGVGSFVAPVSGIVEPITLSIFRYLMSCDLEEATDWIDAALEKSSIPLLGRVHIALLTLLRCGDKRTVAWADDVLIDKLLPEIRRLASLHGIPVLSTHSDK